MEQKAKRTGKINIIDILAIILIILAAVFVGSKLLNRPESAAAAPVKITYVVKAEEVDAELYETSKAYLPSQLMASGKLLNGQIQSVEKEPFLVLDGQGNWVEDPEHVNLLFTVTAEVPGEAVMTTKVDSQEIRVGKTGYILKSEYVEFGDTTIVDVQWEK